MAHRSLWLTVWGIVLVCVTVPHASCQPTPGTSHHEMMPYYKHAQEPNHYYPTFEDEEENSAKDRTNLQDSEHLIEEKATSAEKPLDLTNRAKKGQDVVEVTSFASHRDAAKQRPASQDFFEDFNTLEMPAEEHCRELMICQMRHLMTYVAPLENFIRTYGKRVTGLLRPGYQKALADGSSRRPCKTPKKEGCPNNALNILLFMAQAITGDL